MGAGSYNSYMESRRFGRIDTVVTKVEFGLKIIQYEGASQSRNGITYSFRGAEQDQFTWEVHFRDFDSERKFTEWLANYNVSVSEKADALSPLNCVIPSMWFFARAIPVSAIPFGDVGGKQGRHVTVTFEPVDVDVDQSISKSFLGKFGAAGVDSGWIYFPSPLMENQVGYDAAARSAYDAVPIRVGEGDTAPTGGTGFRIIPPKDLGWLGRGR